MSDCGGSAFLSGDGALCGASAPEAWGLRRMGGGIASSSLDGLSTSGADGCCGGALSECV